jgi:hypothetical protein
MTSLWLPKVTSNLFLALGDNTIPEKGENYFSFHFAAQTAAPWVWAMPSAARQNPTNTFGWCKCADVEISCKIAPRWLAKDACNLVLAFEERTIPEKCENYYHL